MRVLQAVTLLTAAVTMAITNLWFIQSGMTVLDAGCGNARYLAAVTAMVARTDRSVATDRRRAS